jgi:cytochrome c peroxidase
MNSSNDRVIKTLASIPDYVNLLKIAFPDQSDPVTIENMAGAIEAFEATLITPNSRFDRYLDGNERALNESEKKGLSLFISKGCVSCHGGINLGGDGYYRFGVAGTPGSTVLPINDKGRFAITGAAADEYVFKSPSLRNVELTAPYFHTGKVRELKQAVAIMGRSQLDANLSDPEVEEITAFLRTLTGEMPKLEYPVLPAHTASTPLPDTGAGKNRQDKQDF